MSPLNSMESNDLRLKKGLDGGKHINVAFSNQETYKRPMFYNLTDHSKENSFEIARMKFNKNLKFIPDYN
jgi:hypothetical protein